MLLNKFITVMVILTMISLVMLTTKGSDALAQNECSFQGYTACTESDLSLPVPSENEFGAMGSQQRPGDQSRGAGEDVTTGNADGSGNNRNAIGDVSAFLLPFP